MFSELTELVPVSQADPLVAFFLTGSPVENIRPGVFTGPFNTNHLIPRSLVQAAYPRVVGIPKENRWGSSFWVADSPEQFLADFGDQIEAHPHHLVLIFSKVDKAREDPGGWRWHKWGLYVGHQQPTCEYLYDEPVIDVVYVVSAVEVTL